MQIQQIEASMQVHRYYAIKSQKKENGYEIKQGRTRYFENNKRHAQ
jgi:cobyric acid synthase